MAKIRAVVCEADKSSESVYGQNSHRNENETKTSLTLEKGWTIEVG